MRAGRGGCPGVSPEWVCLPSGRVDWTERLSLSCSLLATSAESGQQNIGENVTRDTNPQTDSFPSECGQRRTSIYRLVQVVC